MRRDALARHIWLERDPPGVRLTLHQVDVAGQQLRHPALQLLDPGVLERGRDHDEQRPLVSVDARHRDGLDGLPQTHLWDPRYTPLLLPSSTRDPTHDHGTPQKHNKHIYPRYGSPESRAERLIAFAI